MGLLDTMDEEKYRRLGLRPGQGGLLQNLVNDRPGGASQSLDWSSQAGPERPFVPFPEEFREGIHAGLNAPFGRRELGMPHKYAKPLANSMAFLSELNPELALGEGGFDVIHSADPEHMFEAARAALGFVPGFQKLLGLEKLLDETAPPGPPGPGYGSPSDTARQAAHDQAVMEMIDPTDIGASGVETHHGLKYAVPDPRAPKAEIKVAGTDPAGDMITSAYDPSMAPPEGGEEEVQTAEAEPSIWARILTELAPGGRPATAGGEQPAAAVTETRPRSPEERMQPGLLGVMGVERQPIDHIVRQKGLDYAIRNGLIHPDTVSHLRDLGYLGAT